MAELPKYKRILLKISGEALAGEQKFGILPEVIGGIADQVKEVHGLGVQMAVVIGGGNIFRGVKLASAGMDQAQGDYMGMLATVINGLAFQDILEKKGVSTRLLSAIAMMQVAEPYIRRRAMRHLEKGRVAIFGGGTGNPGFTTDMAAALRAFEIKADIILKATSVDGVYDSDPKKNPNAKRFDKVDYRTVLAQNLKVMDGAAIALCRDHHIPIVVFDLYKQGNIRRVVMGENVGTTVSDA